MEIGGKVQRLAELSIGSIAIATLVLAGCGGGSSSSTTSSTTTVTTPTTIAVSNTGLTGIVTTIAGLAGSWGTVNNTGTAARFNGPGYISSDGTNLYVTDSLENNIRKIVIATGAVTTLAGSQTAVSGVTDAQGTAALFNSPRGIATDGINLYVADTGNNSVRMIVISSGMVSTLAGSVTGASGVADATGTAARFWSPSGVTKMGSSLYVTDAVNSTIRQINLNTNAVSTIAGTAGILGYSNNLAGSAVMFDGPADITNDGVSLYVADLLNHDIRKVNPSNGLTTLVAGGAFNTIPASGVTNGTSSSARFNKPFGLTTDGANIYVGDTDNHTVRKIVLSSGLVSTLAGSAGVFGTSDGTGSAARFNNPRGMVYVNGKLYVADWYNGTIRKIQ
ncbi:MAG: NHL repeat-containing protein [Gallionellaceae bacterium]|nr:MAG: NHL repeat-containing protein [Gallionellaceae bacterium]